MKQGVKEALKSVDMTYNDLIEIVDDTKDSILQDVDYILDGLQPDKLTNDSIRDCIVRLSLKSYYFSEVKDKSAFKAQMAETIRKEAYAKSYGAAEGTVAQRDSEAQLNVSCEIIAEEIHNLMAALFKTKLDEIHRVIDALKTVLMSRMSEAKLINNDLQ